MPTVHERLIQERMAESYRAAYAAGVASRDAALPVDERVITQRKERA